MENHRKIKKRGCSFFFFFISFFPFFSFLKGNSEREKKIKLCQETLVNFSQRLSFFLKLAKEKENWRKKSFLINSKKYIFLNFFSYLNSDSEQKYFLLADYNNDQTKESSERALGFCLNKEIDFENLIIFLNTYEVENNPSLHKLFEQTSGIYLKNLPSSLFSSSVYLSESFSNLEFIYLSSNKELVNLKSEMKEKDFFGKNTVEIIWQNSFQSINKNLRLIMTEFSFVDFTESIHFSKFRSEKEKKEKKKTLVEFLNIYSHPEKSFEIIPIFGFDLRPSDRVFSSFNPASSFLLNRGLLVNFFKYKISPLYFPTRYLELYRKIIFEDRFLESLLANNDSNFEAEKSQILS